MAIEFDYKDFLSTASRKQWERLGLKRRSGVSTALFSLYSKDSVGIGEFLDLKLLVDWCKITGLSIIQLLPLNDAGSDFRPYDAQSTFALEPMYLSIEKLRVVNLQPFRERIRGLRESFPLSGAKRVNYKIKEPKLNLLWEIFKNNQEPNNAFKEYIQQNKFWIEDYAIFKVIKEKNQNRTWEDWGAGFKQRDARILNSFKMENSERIMFYQWLQWQAFEQLRTVKEYAISKGVFLMGDLPFLVSRDSADVWAHQENFKLDFCAGAPPDMYFAQGQRWGMPVYNWETIERNGYDYIKERLKYAQNFYDLFRIDHAVGLFRVWAIKIDEPKETFGLNGKFQPQDENVWEGHGKKILSVIVENTRMLACAEDLGVVPLCSNKVLAEFGIPGTEVERWVKDWGNTYNFKEPKDYRKNSIATIATHDSSSLCGWWVYEAGTVDGELFKRKCNERGIVFEEIKDRLFDLKNSFYGRLRWKNSISDVEILSKTLNSSKEDIGDLIGLYKESFQEKDKFLKYLGLEKHPQGECSNELIRSALEKINSSASIFSIQLLGDWLSLGFLKDYDIWEFRINFPGTISEKNWSLVMPMALEDMLNLSINSVIKDINSKTGRV